MLLGHGVHGATKYAPKTVEHVIKRLENVSCSVASIANGSEMNFCHAIVSQASVCMGVLRDGLGRLVGTNAQKTGSAL